MRRRNVLILWGILVLSCSPKTQHDLVIADVGVVDVKNGKLLENHSVAIDSNRISKIYSEEAFFSDSTKIIDGTNKFLIPGLWDMHVHVHQYEERFFPLFVAHGVTGIRDMHNPSNDNIGHWKDSINQSGGMHPRIGLVAGRIVDTKSEETNWPGTITLKGKDSIRQKVIDVALNKGYDFLKILDQLSIEQFNKINKEAQTAGLYTAGHLPVGVSWEHAIKMGMRSFEHVGGYFGYHINLSTKRDSLLAVLQEARTHMLGWHLYDLQEKAEHIGVQHRDDELVKKIMGLLKQYNAFPCTVLLYADDQLLKRPYKESELPELGLEYLPDSLANKFSEELTKPFGEAAQAYLEQYKVLHEGSLRFIKDFEKFEVPFMAGTDASSKRAVVPGISLHGEMQVMAQSGVKPITILKSATLYPAQFMEKEATYGTVEAGKLADLVLLKKNPLEDIAHAAEIEAVILDGVHYSREELDQKLTSLKLMSKIP